MPHMQPSSARNCASLPAAALCDCTDCQNHRGKNPPGPSAVADFLASLATFSIDRKSPKISCAKNRPFPPAV